eukprot:scaffold165040_cov27-Tisochrysis_lutea.AAC.2
MWLRADAQTPCRQRAVPWQQVAVAGTAHSRGPHGIGSMSHQCLRWAARRDAPASDTRPLSSMCSREAEEPVL